MKMLRRALLLVLTSALAVAAGCTTVPATKGPNVWNSGRPAGVEADEPSKQIDTYTLKKGTATEFTVANYFNDDMIVPRDRRIEIWGTAPEMQNGQIVEAEFKGLKGSGVIEDGKFCFALQGTLPASKEKGHSLIVKGASGVQKEFKDVIVGDIWIVSGQSNSDLTFWGTVSKSTKDLKTLYSDYLDQASEEDDIRILQQINWSLLSKTGVERMSSPQDDIGRSNKWQVASRKKVYNSGSSNSFSMLGYFFAKELYTINPEVPVGIVMGGCGGAPLALLVSEEARAKFPESLRDRTITLNDIVLPYSGIYNAFMAPLTHVGITGIIFYQGESDALLSEEYSDALKIAVEDYRKQYGSNLLFLNVQLTSYGYESGGSPLNGVWDAVPQMRFAQSKVKVDGSISRYEVIPTIDVGWRKGDGDGAHPYYKLPIGERGAKIAAALIYGIGDIENVGYPVPNKISYTKEEVIIEYSYAGGGLKTSDGKAVAGFEVKVGDTWQIAFPDIEGNKITIKVEDACGVRYAPELRYLADQRDLSDLTMAKANLVSGTGNIAVPFCVEFDNG